MLLFVGQIGYIAKSIKLGGNIIWGGLRPLLMGSIIFYGLIY